MVGVKSYHPPQNRILITKKSFTRFLKMSDHYLYPLLEYYNFVTGGWSQNTKIKHSPKPMSPCFCNKISSPSLYMMKLSQLTQFVPINIESKISTICRYHDVITSLLRYRRVTLEKCWSLQKTWSDDKMRGQSHSYLYFFAK